MVYSISQKLIQHQMLNYSEVLRWLREVLNHRNTFLQRHRDSGHVGKKLFKQAQIKVEVRGGGGVDGLFGDLRSWVVWEVRRRKAFEGCFVQQPSPNHHHFTSLLSPPPPQTVFFMYLWSIDTNAVLTALSCFQAMCEEGDIRGVDEAPVTHFLPNYPIYMELAAASTVLTTGWGVMVYGVW